jgi:hypothetical protein
MKRKNGGNKRNQSHCLTRRTRPSQFVLRIGRMEYLPLAKSAGPPGGPGGVAALPLIESSNIQLPRNVYSKTKHKGLERGRKQKSNGTASHRPRLSGWGGWGVGVWGWALHCCTGLRATGAVQENRSATDQADPEQRAKAAKQHFARGARPQSQRGHRNSSRCVMR